MTFLRSCWILYIVLNVLVMSAFQVTSTCPTVKLPNGRVELRSNGRLVDFKCKKRFELVGVRFAVCLTAGQWSQQIPTCVGTTCKRPDPQPNQIVEGLYNGGVLKYSCTAGLTRSGPETLMCDGERWSDAPPKCKETTTMGCSFEEEDLCGWSQDITDDFDWSRNKGETPTAKTGPSFDHTTNSSEGHYLFMESSSPQKEGQKTRLISPPYTPEKTKDMCLEFYYHMKGPDGDAEVGDLDVYVRPQSMEMTQISKAKNIFHLGGNQGDRWQRADADIPQQDEPFNIVFQATRLKSWTGDIAIDDVNLVKCVQKTPTTKAPVEERLNDASDDTSTRSIATKKAPRRLPTTQKQFTVTRRRRPRQSTTTTPPSSTTVKKAPSPSKVIPPAYTPTARELSKTSTMTTTTQIIIETVVSDNKNKGLTHSNLPSDDSRSTSERWTTSMNKMTSYLSSAFPHFKTTAPIENAFKTENSSRRYERVTRPSKDVTVDSDESITKSGKSGQVVPSDYIDYTDIDFNGNRNTSANSNDSQTPFVDYDYGKTDSGGTTPNSDVDSEIDGLFADVGSVKDDDASPGTLPYLPLIIGIVASVLVGVIVIAVLAWMWARSQRKKQEKSPEDQMNIITEYVETNLSV